MTPQQVVPVTSELGRMQILLIGEGEKQAVVSAVVLHEGFDVSP